MTTELSVFLRHAKRSNKKELDLSKKELSCIPKAIEVLDLADNKIHTVEPVIADLFRLRELNLQNNCVVELPQQISTMPKLSKLILTGNPLDKKYHQLLNPKNQQIPNLIHCLQSCFESEGNEQAQTPSWLMEGAEQKKPIDRQSYNKQSMQSSIQWDQSIFKVQSKVPSQQPSKNHVRRMNRFGINNLSSGSSSNQPQIQVKNGVLQPRLESVQIHEQISMGGFSTIHRGQYQGLQVAVKKLFNPNVNEELMLEFDNQLLMLARYRHPKIVLLIAAVTVPPTLCIVMEFIKGGTLYDVLHKRKNTVNMTDSNRKHIVQQLISAFLYLHNHGIVHRDIKSHNILIQSDSTFDIKVCDFGLARHRNDLNSGLMQFCGTPTYMAQQLFLKKGYDQSVDIFALGTLFYEIYAREVPYAGMDPSDIKEKVIQNSDLPSKYSIKKQIVEIVNRCRRQKPSDRPTLKELKQFTDW